MFSVEGVNISFEIFLTIWKQRRESCEKKEAHGAIQKKEFEEITTLLEQLANVVI